MKVAEVTNEVVNRLGTVTGYDIKVGESLFENIGVGEVIKNELELSNASIIFGKVPYIRGNRKLSIRVTNDSIIIHHGSVNIIEKPVFGQGKKENDYGLGFYTTEEKDRADEWACIQIGGEPVCNTYEIDVDGLKVINLDKFDTIVWLATVLKNRGEGNRNLSIAAEEICNRYAVNVEEYDIVTGYRADDSYFKIIQEFLSGNITIEDVNNFFHKGKLGRQVCIKSKTAFDRIKFIGYNNCSEKRKYALNNDRLARETVSEMIRERRKDALYGRLKGTTIKDILSL